MLTATKPLVFVSSHRAKFHEIDTFGHLNNVHYLSYFNEHRWIGLRENLGIDMAALKSLGFSFFASRAEVRYLRSVFADETFTIRSWIAEQGQSECRLEGEMIKDHRKAAEFTMDIVCIDAETGKRRTWDSEFISKFYMTWPAREPSSKDVYENMVQLGSTLRGIPNFLF